jgi:protein-S-isoprenylcysteine O-methyltransferase Ste14
MNDLLTLGLIAVLLPVAGALVFARVSRDYARIGRLMRATTALQVGLFALHGASSYLFLESDFAALDAASPLFGFALVLIGGGLILLVSTIGRFGVSRTMGNATGSLVCAGMYRKSRNPQLLFYGIVVVGYALLWPSWTGAIWVALYVALGLMMVRVEEQHLKRTHGKDYVDYCVRTPRFLVK